MKQQGDKATVFFMLAVMAFAIVLVDDRWVRVGLGTLPALLLAQRALGGAGVGTDEDASRVGAADRRTDTGVRRHIDDVLKQVRDFYTTCHLTAVGKLEPEEAKSRAVAVERRLNELLAQISDAAGADGGQT